MSIKMIPTSIPGCEFVVLADAISETFLLQQITAAMARVFKFSSESERTARSV